MNIDEVRDFLKNAGYNIYKEKKYSIVENKIDLSILELPIEQSIYLPREYGYTKGFIKEYCVLVRSIGKNYNKEKCDNDEYCLHIGCLIEHGYDRQIPNYFNLEDLFFSKEEIISEISNF